MTPAQAKVRAIKNDIDRQQRVIRNLEDEIKDATSELKRLKRDLHLATQHS
jgi:peptidoglycan hydrolase CwlO-like protein